MIAATLTEALCSDLLNLGFGRLYVGSDIVRRIEGIYAHAKDFFDLPLAERLAYQLGNDSGFCPYGVEYSGAADQPDPIESFAATPRLPITSVPDRPAAAHALYREMLLAIDLLERLAEPIIIALASTVSRTDQTNTVSGSIRRWSSLQVNRALQVPAGTPLHQLHEDGHLLTLAFANAAGLEIQNADGVVTPISPEADCAIVMPGEIASLLSAGLVRPLFHRAVRHPRIIERMAVLYFVDLDPRACQPWRLGPVNEGVDIGQRVLSNAARFGRKPFELE
jgi:isopenicillin N synthase-like dioxygenase